MKLVATRKSEQNVLAIDPWTLVHVGVGLALGLIGAPADKALIGAVVYEVGEYYVEQQPWGQQLFQTQQPETTINILVDLVAFAVGLEAGRRWNRT